MFPKLKKLFSKVARPERGPLVSSASTVQKIDPAPAPSAPVGLPVPQSSSRPEVTSSASDSIAISLESVIDRLPAALRSHVDKSGRGHISILVPIKRISEQLIRGAIRISFGELKQASPIGTFIRSTSEDATIIELPMQEIIPRLNSSYLARRAGQRRIEVPEDVFPVFGPKGQTLVPSQNRAPGQSSITSTSIAIPLVPMSTNSSVTEAGMQQSDIRLPLVEPPSAAPSGIISVEAPVTDEQSARILSPKTTIASSSDGREDSENGVFTIKLQTIASNWPLNVRQEITQASLFHLSVELPAAEIEAAMKRGKAVFTWKQIRTRIKSSIPLKGSLNDETQVELSLAAIVPLFLARKKEEKPRRLVSGVEHIPDIFTSSVSGPSPTPIAFMPPDDAAVPDFDEPSRSPERTQERLKSTEQPRNELGKIFGHPEKQNWTPVEIVQKTSALTGASGAIITLQDGLLVAGELPPGQKTETFAAFLPQIFSKIDQYTAEMKLGKISEISVVVDKIPLQIFKTGKVFFGVLGRPDQLLPMAKLSAIAVELGRPTT